MAFGPTTVFSSPPAIACGFPQGVGTTLLYLPDHSHRDIAALLGLSETNAATKLHRLKQRRRRRLESHI